MNRDFTSHLGPWGLGGDMDDCFDCGNRGYIETQAASVTFELPCPSCSRGDFRADDAAAGWAEQ